MWLHSAALSLFSFYPVQPRVPCVSLCFFMIFLFQPISSFVRANNLENNPTFRTARTACVSRKISRCYIGRSSRVEIIGSSAVLKVDLGYSDASGRENDYILVCLTFHPFFSVFFLCALICLFWLVWTVSLSSSVWKGWVSHGSIMHNKSR